MARYAMLMPSTAQQAMITIPTQNKESTYKLSPTLLLRSSGKSLQQHLQGLPHIVAQQRFQS
jgi:hypothetical protein